MLVDILVDIGKDLFEIRILDFAHVDLDGGVAVGANAQMGAGGRRILDGRLALAGTALVATCQDPGSADGNGKQQGLFQRRHQFPHGQTAAN